MKLNISQPLFFMEVEEKIISNYKKIPKPLAIVSKKPFIYYIIEQLIYFKIKENYISVRL